jgi:lipopolysaccharide export system permease protein
LSRPIIVPRLKLDRYILGLMMRPVVAAILVTLIAQLLERVLRIIQLLTENGAHVGFVVQLAVNLVPYYLTFSLPAAFFIAIFLVVSRMGDGNEIDAILASGVSISRFAAPFVGMGLVFMMLSLLLFGFLQPYGRYAYRAVLNAAINAGWNAQLQPEVFVDPGHGFTITADRVSMSGRNLHGVFVRRVSPDGREQITTATSGRLEVGADGRLVNLTIDKGLNVDMAPGRRAQVLRIENVSASEPLKGVDVTTTPRGGDPRELTLFELSHELRAKSSVIPKRALQADLYGRLVRSLSVPFLPLMAIPLGMAAKRSGRAPGLILAGVLLIGFHHAVQLTQSLAENGKLSPALIWGIFAVFAGLCSWLYLSSLQRPGDTPITRAVGAVGDLANRIRDLFAREAVGAQRP